MTTVYIHLKGNNEVVALSNDDLASADLTQILLLLINEESTLEEWLKVAIAYKSLGDDISFQKILYTCSGLQSREILFFSNENNQIISSTLNEDCVNKFNAIIHIYKNNKRTRIAILNALSSYYILKARKMKDRKIRDELFKHSTKLINRCDSIDNQETMTWINKAIMHLYKDNIPSAQNLFSNVLRENPYSRIARIGLGLCYFKTDKLKEALKELSHVFVSLFENSDSSEEDLTGLYSNLRNSIGTIWSRLNSPDKAILAYERQYEQTPNNDQVLSGLGTLLLNRYYDRLLMSNSDEEVALATEDYERAVKYFSEAFNINSSNYIASNQLSNYLFVSSEEKDHKKITNLALKAHHSTSNPKVQAESFYYLGRSAHVQGQFDDAFKHYSDSPALWPTFILPYYGLGQIYMKRNQNSKAIESFTKVYDKYPDNLEVNKVLSHLHSKSNREKSIKHLQKAIKLQPNDAELWIDYAQLLETVDSEECLNCYLSAIKCFESSESIPYQLWNNLGCTRMQVKDFELSKDSFLRALIKNTIQSLPNVSNQKISNNEGREISLQSILDEIHQTSPTESLSIATTEAIMRSIETFPSIFNLESNITMIFNLGRVYESMKYYDEALKIFQQIIEKYPSYNDCKIRLGCIYKNQGLKDKAVEAFKNILESNDKNIDAMTYLANISFENKEYQIAQNHFDKILSIDKKDMYSVLQLANISLKAGIKEIDPVKKEKFIQRATDFFSSVIKSMPNNVYAANGLGIIFMQRKLSIEASDTFLFLREATDDIPDVWINLGHSYFSKNDFSSAINIYERCIKKFGFDHPSVIEGNVPVLLGQCYFYTDKFELAKEIMLKAIEVCPNKEDIRYDYATLCKEYALKILKLTSKSNVSMKSLKLAVDALQIAGPIFEQLSTSQSKRSFSTKKCEKFHKLCVTNIELADDKLKESEALEKRLEEDRIKNMKEEEELMKLEEEKELQRLKEIEEKAREAEEAALEFYKKTEDLKQTWNANSQGSGGGDDDERKSKKRKKSLKHDDFLDTVPYEEPEEEENLEEKKLSALDEIRKKRKE